jgi:hypothetical protein
MTRGGKNSSNLRIVFDDGIKFYVEKSFTITRSSKMQEMNDVTDVAELSRVYHD